MGQTALLLGALRETLHYNSTRLWRCPPLHSPRATLWGKNASWVGQVAPEGQDFFGQEEACSGIAVGTLTLGQGGVRMPGLGSGSRGALRRTAGEKQIISGWKLPSFIPGGLQDQGFHKDHQNTCKDQPVPEQKQRSHLQAAEVPFRSVRKGGIPHKRQSVVCYLHGEMNCLPHNISVDQFLMDQDLTMRSKTIRTAYKKISF